VEAPENTLLAFRKAVQAGASYLETDVRLSRDGVAVISHDPDLMRVAGEQLAVAELSMAELRSIDLGFGQGFCSLDEALDAFPGARFNIDIKADGAEQAAADAILRTGSLSRVLITAFSEPRRSRTVEHLPGVATSASTLPFFRAMIAAKTGIRPLGFRALRGIQAVQIPERYRRMRILSTRLVRAMHRQGIEVHVWTINEPDEMRRVLGMGVDGIFTDRCDLALEVAGELAR
jgi:glycerophosphoryl diester phosphodiesterase